MRLLHSRVLLGVVAIIGLGAWGAYAQTKTTAAAAGSTATGEFIVNGKSATFTSAVAKTTPDSFEPSKTGYTLILSDVKGLPDKYGSIDKVAAGTLHYVELTLGNDKSIYGAIFHHSAFKNNVMTSAGGIKLEASTYGPDVLAGKAYTAAPRSAEGTTFQFTATFKVPIEKTK